MSNKTAGRPDEVGEQGSKARPSQVAKGHAATGRRCFRVSRLIYPIKLAFDQGDARQMRLLAQALRN
jgi:hypothetical protein